jgi:hypothetical protein
MPPNKRLSAHCSYSPVAVEESDALPGCRFAQVLLRRRCEASRIQRHRVKWVPALKREAVLEDQLAVAELAVAVAHLSACCHV